ncbi:CorA family divalent cation transporter [Octadecabacter sp. R77987]|uniref:CorA family divalent cation transporter n=1 Tax=Octadecabacter sp. R77987 TaxID=3093874 RepID=UPI00366E0764
MRLWYCRRRVFAVDDLRQAALANAAPPSVGAFVAALATGLVARIESTSLALDDLADAMGDAVYEGDAPTLPDLAPLRRQVIKLRRHVGPQTAALHDLARLETALFPRALRAALRDSANRATRTDEELHEVRERLTALADHMHMAQTTRMGRNSYVLSVIAGIFLPLGVITGLFGVNLAGMPGADQPWAFAALCIAMGVIILAGWALLRWKRWL